MALVKDGPSVWVSVPTQETQRKLLISDKPSCGHCSIWESETLDARDGVCVCLSVCMCVLNKQVNLCNEKSYAA